jgi:hypothetical protein
MTSQTHELLIEPRSEYLDSWRWMVGGDATLVAASLSGDLFFHDRTIHEHDGRVHWIDTGVGSVECVADDVARFRHKIRTYEFCREYLLENIVADELRIHGKLPPDRCFGYRKLPVFGGDYSGDNRVPMRAAEHFAFTGDVHRQIDGLPDGATVELVTR